MSNHAWNTGEPPKDREIVLFGNVVHHDDAFTSVEPVFGRVAWSEKARHYCYTSNGMSVILNHGDRLVVHYWIDIPEDIRSSLELALVPRCGGWDD